MGRLEETLFSVLTEAKFDLGKRNTVAKVRVSGMPGNPTKSYCRENCGILL